MSSAPTSSAPAAGVPVLRRTPASSVTGSAAPAAPHQRLGAPTATGGSAPVIARSTNPRATPGTPAGSAVPAAGAPTYPTPAAIREVATPTTSPSTVLRWARVAPAPAGGGSAAASGGPVTGFARTAPPAPGGVPVPGLLARADRGGEPLRRTPAGPTRTTAGPMAASRTSASASTAGPWTPAAPPSSTPAAASSAMPTMPAPTMPGLAAQSAQSGQSGQSMQSGPPVPVVGLIAPPGAGPTGGPGAAPAGRISRMTVAPPRISISPSRGDGPAAPPVPSVARTSGPTSTPTSTPAGAPRSLVESTAHLFSSVPEGVVRRLLDEGGTSMSGHQHESWSPGGSAPSSPGTVVRRWSAPSGGSPATTMAGQGPAELDDDLQPGGALEALVDAVVERVEQRVIDELERRGRRQDWAAF
ncbi:hypothetical protein [Nocardioides sp. W7]|uniref:hypothetical protein n=1 Tax=Nocardioides sp. W7 TaxID=2931390 RepID=UPI001FD07531|nr:hypothetical protein [Nocardioides sp. W7]